MGRFRLRFQAILSTVASNVSLNFGRSKAPLFRRKTAPVHLRTWDDIHVRPEGSRVTEEYYQVTPDRGTRLIPLTKFQATNSRWTATLSEESVVDSVHDADSSDIYVYDAGNDIEFGDTISASSYASGLDIEHAYHKSEYDHGYRFGLSTFNLSNASLFQSFEPGADGWDEAESRPKTSVSTDSGVHCFDTLGPATDEWDLQERCQTMEDILEDMLSDSLEHLPLAAFPLQAPEFGPGFLASLGLPSILPLAPRSIHREAESIAENPNNNTISLLDFRALPLTGHELPQDDQYPPPYLALPPPSASSKILPQNCLIPDKVVPSSSKSSTDIVGVIRTAVTLLFQDTRAALFNNTSHDSLRVFDVQLVARFEELEELMHFWSGGEFSLMDGVDRFKDVLSDGTILHHFMSLLPSSIHTSSHGSRAEDIFQRFIEIYESLSLPDAIALPPYTFETATPKELAAYAQAVIFIHNKFSTTPPLYDLGSQATQVDLPALTLEDGLPFITDEDSSNITPVPLAPSPLPDDPLYEESTDISDADRATLIGDSTYLGISELPEDDILLYQQVLSVIRDEEKFCEVLLRGKTEIQSLLDLLQYMLSFPQIVKNARCELLAVLVRVSTAAALYPRAFRLASDPQIDKEPVTCGYYGDILRGYVEEQGVCVKVVKLYRKMSNSDKFLKSFMREIVIWGQLQHPNILPFYGVYHLGDAEERICLVSPWMENGTLVDYLKACPDVNRPLLVRDVALGLEYLHDKMIVHGDLKGINILVTLCGRACLADFGLASVNDTEVVRFSMLESTGHQGATPRYEAPELLDDCDDRIHRTMASDIYAFGGVCYEVFTGKMPFYEIASPYTIMVKIMNGETPTRPTDESLSESGLDVTDEIWSLITSCWNQGPQGRPSAAEILSSALLKDLDDVRLEEEEIWSSSRYRSVLDREDGPGFIACNG